jgi:hypothetical protein
MLEKGSNQKELERAANQVLQQTPKFKQTHTHTHREPISNQIRINIERIYLCI